MRITVAILGLIALLAASSASATMTDVFAGRGTGRYTFTDDVGSGSYSCSDYKFTIVLSRNPLVSGWDVAYARGPPSASTPLLDCNVPNLEWWGKGSGQPEVEGSPEKGFHGEAKWECQHATLEIGRLGAATPVTFRKNSTCGPEYSEKFTGVAAFLTV